MAQYVPPISAKFPYEDDEKRLAGYSYFEKLSEGEHFDAFSLRGDKGFTKEYAKLRYVVANFAGLVSKTVADFLFSEEVRIQSDTNQDWLDTFYHANKMRMKNYESAFNNSAVGDAIFRIRVVENEIKIEDINPSLYFSHKRSVNDTTETEELSWIEERGEDEKFLIREIYKPGFVITQINELMEKEIGKDIDVEEYNNINGTQYQAEIQTNIDRNLLIHIPNFRIHRRFYGISDYKDIDTLIFALNNRITKVDNILDKHGDPILTVPPGVLDENGQVKKEAFGMIEVGMGEDPPNYIVWDASLQSAFQEIDKLVEFLYIFSEISADTAGLGKQGQAESGRALKLRLFRTLALIKRKQLYYKQGLKELFYTAQLLAKENGYTAEGLKITQKPSIPDIAFQDGIVNDEKEMIENESLKLEQGLSSKKRSIKVIEGVNDEEAEKIAEEAASGIADISF